MSAAMEGGRVTTGVIDRLAHTVGSYGFVRWTLPRSERLVGALDRRLAATPAWIGAVAFVLALQWWLIFTHQPWRDEYQALQIAVQAPDLRALLVDLSYEGHPPLWFLLLRGLAHIMDPLQALPVAAALLATITQLVILLRAPFTRGERMMVALSEFVLFEFNTLSRSLTLGVCLVVCAAALWRSRWFWVVFAAMALNDFLFGVISLALLALKFRDRDVWWPGIALWMGCSLFAAWTVIPASDMVPPIEDFSRVSFLTGWINRMGVLGFPLQWRHGFSWDATQPLFIKVFAWAPTFLFFWWQTRGDRLHRAVLFGFITLTGVFSVFVYPLPIRHLMLAALLLIVLEWRAAAVRGEGSRSPGFRLWLLGATGCGLAMSAGNAFQTFDTGPQAVARIRDMGLENENWMAFPASRGQTVTALSGIRFEHPQMHCLQTYTRWNHRAPIVTLTEMEAFLRKELALHGKFYMMTNINFGYIDDNLIQLVSFVPGGFNEQESYLYAIGPYGEKRELGLPPCVEGLRPFTRF